MNGYFGYPALPNAIIVWGARAIFHPNQKFPLDLLHDRQGHVNCDKDVALTVKFHKIVNELLPKLQKITKYFSSNERTKFVRHFGWIGDDDLCMVAMGSPNGSYGYFYICVNLVKKSEAPEEIKHPSEIREDERPAREAADKQRQLEDARASRKHHAARRETRKKVQVEVETKINGRNPLDEDAELATGEYFLIEANQGLRDAFVLAIIGEEALIEYYMPNGRKFLRIVDKDDRRLVRNVSEARLPKKWQVTSV